MSELPVSQETRESPAAVAFQVFCAGIFLSMIGLVFYNAMLRYVFKSSFAPSEEWARILFIYISFFGAIEAFYRGRHIAVDMLTSKLQGSTRKAVDVVAHILGLGAMVLLLIGGISLVKQTMDTETVATGLNMVFVNGTLPVMAFAVIVIRIREFIATLRKPASQFVKTEKHDFENEL